MLDKRLQCISCGRDFAGHGLDTDIYPGAPCPVTDECPSHFEERGIEHPDHPVIPAMYTPTTGPEIDKPFFVFAYSMSERDRLYEMDRPSIEFDGFRHVVGYYDCPTAANYDVNLLINTDEVDFDLCWSIGQIPLCNDTNYQH